MEDSVHSPNLPRLSSAERLEGWAAGAMSRSHRMLIISEVREAVESSTRPDYWVIYEMMSWLPSILVPRLFLEAMIM